MTQAYLRPRPGRRWNAIDKGSLVNKDYNKHMGYVDKADMLKSVYDLDRKSREWWHRIAFYFLDVSLVNASFYL